MPGNPFFGLIGNEFPGLERVQARGSPFQSKDFPLHPPQWRERCFPTGRRASCKFSSPVPFQRARPSGCPPTIVRCDLQTKQRFAGQGVGLRAQVENDWFAIETGLRPRCPPRLVADGPPARSRHFDTGPRDNPAPNLFANKTRPGHQRPPTNRLARPRTAIARSSDEVGPAC